MPTETEERGRPLLLSTAATLFLEFARVELQFSPQTIIKYHDCLRRIVTAIGDIPVSEIAPPEISRLKSHMLGRNNGVCRQVVVLAALKRLLAFCRDQLKINGLDPASIIIPRRPRREVVFLTPGEIARFVAAFPLTTMRDRPHLQGLRFRALVECLLGSAMRIGELLSLNRTDIDFSTKEARVIGKGNKERVVFFTDRALYWLNRYLDLRTDQASALFVSQDNKTRLSRTDIWRPFSKYRKKAGLSKPVRPHLLRHTAATQLLFNGCPIGHIKEILGHERLETTCRYYLGLDRRAAKLAHQTYLKYDTEDQESQPILDVHRQPTGAASYL